MPRMAAKIYGVRLNNVIRPTCCNMIECKIFLLLEAVPYAPQSSCPPHHSAKPLVRQQLSCLWFAPWSAQAAGSSSKPSDCWPVFLAGSWCHLVKSVAAPHGVKYPAQRRMARRCARLHRHGLDPVRDFAACQQRCQNVALRETAGQRRRQHGVDVALKASVFVKAGVFMDLRRQQDQNARRLNVVGRAIRCRREKWFCCYVVFQVFWQEVHSAAPVPQRRPYTAPRPAAMQALHLKWCRW